MYNFLGESSSYALQTSDRHAVIESEQKEKSNDHMTRVLEQRHAIEQRKRKYSEFVSGSKNFLLEDALYQIFNKCIPNNVDDSLRSHGRNIIKSFVKEEGASKLLESFKTRTLFLSELSSIVESTHKQVLHDNEDKDGPFRISNSAYKEFSKKIDNMDSAGITKNIMTRVTKAEEEFIAANIKDKEIMEELSAKTKEKIDNVRGSTGTEDQIRQEYAAIYKESITNNVIHRKKGILESIVTAMSTSIVKEDLIRENFIKEDGKLDTDRIIEMSEIMYTVLEMLNTIKAKKFTPEYLTEVISSIK